MEPMGKFRSLKPLNPENSQPSRFLFPRKLGRRKALRVLGFRVSGS